MVISDEIPAVPRNRKLSEYRWEPFHGRKYNSEFRSVEQKWKQTLRIPFRTLPQKSEQLGTPYRGTKMEANSRAVLNHSAEEKTTQNKTQQPFYHIFTRVLCRICVSYNLLQNAEFGTEGKHFVSGNICVIYFWAKAARSGGPHRSVLAC